MDLGAGRVRQCLGDDVVAQPVDEVGGGLVLRRRGGDDPQHGGGPPSLGWIGDTA
jgi:hypothetical protein